MVRTPLARRAGGERKNTLHLVKALAPAEAAPAVAEPVAVAVHLAPALVGAIKLREQRQCRLFRV